MNRRESVLDSLRVEVERALRAAYPDWAEEQIRELEKLGVWLSGLNPALEWLKSRGLEVRAREAIGVGSSAQLSSFDSTAWIGWMPTGAVPWGTELLIGRDLMNLPSSFFHSPGRIANGTSLLLFAMTLIPENVPSLSQWQFEMRLNDRYYYEGLDAYSASQGILLPIPIRVTSMDDLYFRLTLRYDGSRTYHPGISADAPYRFGIRVQGIQASP